MAPEDENLPPDSPALAGIQEWIAANPYASDFAFTNLLKCFKQFKIFGLSNRHYFFVEIDETNCLWMLSFSWLDSPGKASDRNDCHKAIPWIAQQGDPQNNWAALSWSQ